jgi:hypothetical protein
MMIASTIALNPMSSSELMATTEYDSAMAKARNANAKISRQTAHKMFRKYRNLLGKFTQYLK